MLLTVPACSGNDDAAAPASTTPGVAAVTVALAADSVAVGRTQHLTAGAKDANGAVVAGVSFTWASSNSAVATVSDGTATGVGPGAARITASSGGVTSDPVTLAVIDVPKGSVVIDKANCTHFGLRFPIRLGLGAVVGGRASRQRHVKRQR